MCDWIWRYRSLFAVLMVFLLPLQPLAGQDPAAAAAEKVKAAEAALKEAQEAYRKALRAQAAALREQADALEAKAEGKTAPAASVPARPTEGAKPTISAAKPQADVPKPTPTTEKISASPESTTLESGDQEKIALKLGKEALKESTAKAESVEKGLCASRLELKWIEGGETFTVAAKKLPAGVKRLDCTVVVKSKTTTAKDLQIPVSVVDEKAGEWESRAVFGFHQAGASSSDSTQNYFFDFFIMRGLGSHAKVYDSRFNIWGNVRIASSPQQVDSSVANFVANFATKAGELKVNELAQSGEFLTGLGVKIKAWRQGGDRVRMLEGVGFWGANGAFRDPGSSVRVYKIPGKDTAQWPVFERNFGKELAAVSGVAVKPEYAGFTPPDRERFYRQYGGGLRLSTFELRRPYAPPATYMITLGRDQLITEGLYKGAVVRADVFYPLPIGKKDGKFQFLFLFGTANLRINKPANLDVLALEPMLKEDGKTPSVNIYDPKVLVISRPSARDTYRIGAGVDFVNLFNSWRGAK